MNRTNSNKRYKPKLSDAYIISRKTTNITGPYISFLTEFLSLWKSDIKSNNPILRYKAFYDVEAAKHFHECIDLLLAIEATARISIDKILQEIKPLVTEDEIVDAYNVAIQQQRELQRRKYLQAKQVKELPLTA